MRKLAANVYVETTLPGVNVGAVVTQEGIICIDTPTRAEDARRWRQQLAELSAKPILYVINTDHHRDRVLGNQWFDAPVVAHERAGERLRLYPEIFKNSGGDGSWELEPRELAGVRIVPPQITFTDELTLLKGGREIVVRHRPGVSPGAAWVILPSSGVVFTGDSVVVGVHPFLGEADLQQWLESLSELCRAKFPARVIVPGRGKVTNKEGVKQIQNYLKRAHRRMQALVNSRRPRSDVAAVAADLVKQVATPEHQREAVLRRVRAELDRMYDVMRGEVE